MSPRIIFDPDVPAEAREAILPHLEREVALAPSWCHDLLVGWDATNSADALNIVGHPEYRWARLTICPPWLTSPEQRRAEEVRHEMVHLPLQPMHRCFHDLLDALAKEEGPLRAWAEEQWRRAWEGAVCDLTIGVDRAIRAS